MPTGCIYVFMYFVWISEQAAIIYVFCMDLRASIDYLCILYGSQSKQRLFMYSVWISEQAAIIYVFCMDLRASSDYLCILYGSQSKQRLFPYKTSNDWNL